MAHNPAWMVALAVGTVHAGVATVHGQVATAHGGTAAAHDSMVAVSSAGGEGSVGIAMAWNPVAIAAVPVQETPVLTGVA